VELTPDTAYPDEALASIASFAPLADALIAEPLFACTSSAENPFSFPVMVWQLLFTVDEQLSLNGCACACLVLTRIAASAATDRML
jgi:hypothetical protein